LGSKTEGSIFWDDHSELNKYFGTKNSFFTWMGRHLWKLPPDYELEDIIELRKRLNRRKGIK